MYVVHYGHVFSLQYNGANIQLLDLPGIIEGAAQGKRYLWCDLSPSLFNPSWRAQERGVVVR